VRWRVVIIDSSDDEVKEMEVGETTTPQYTPKSLPKSVQMEESTTPKYTPGKSFTPMGWPKYMGVVDSSISISISFTSARASDQKPVSVIFLACYESC
jgi:hypothetical protein